MASYTQVTPEEEVAGLMSASERRRRFIAAEAEKENAIKARAVNALAEDEALGTPQRASRSPSTRTATL